MFLHFQLGKVLAFVIATPQRCYHSSSCQTRAQAIALCSSENRLPHGIQLDPSNRQRPLCFLSTCYSISVFHLSLLSPINKASSLSNLNIRTQHPKMSSDMDKVKQCEAVIGYEFANKAFGLEALYNFPGYRREPGADAKKNDALAIFGEVVLLQNLCQEWYRLNLSIGAFFQSTKSVRYLTSHSRMDYNSTRGGE